jgi:RecB family exonuclease
VSVVVPLTQLFAMRAIAKLRPALSLWDYDRARKIAELTGSTYEHVRAQVWPDTSESAARRAFNRLQARIVDAAEASAWPLELVLSGEPSAVSFRGRVVSFTSAEMGCSLEHQFPGGEV